MPVRSYASLAADILALPPRCGQVRVVAVDGRAGSGKTTFARRLAAAVGDGAVVWHTDDALAAGWRELTGYWLALDAVLRSLAAGLPGRYLRYDWDADRLGGEAAVPVCDVLVVEGVGSLGATRGRRSLGVRVEAAPDVRLRRGVERDGEGLRPQWLQWMRQEDAYFASVNGAEPADVVVDGDPPDTVAEDVFVVGFDRRGSAGGR